jgi:hypothetical protein
MPRTSCGRGLLKHLENLLEPLDLALVISRCCRTGNLLLAAFAILKGLHDLPPRCKRP